MRGSALDSKGSSTLVQGRATAVPSKDRTSALEVGGHQQLFTLNAYPGSLSGGPLRRSPPPPAGTSHLWPPRHSSRLESPCHGAAYRHFPAEVWPSLLTRGQQH